MPHYQRNIKFVLFLILPILGFLLGWSLSQKNSVQNPTVTVKVENPLDTEEVITEPQVRISRRNIKPRDVDLSLFWETWNAMDESFLYQDKIKVESQVYGAIKGLINSLEDPYTIFMTPEETKKFEESISGEFEGIGAEIAIRDGQLLVISPLKGSPAELAGVRAGDKIFKIDDTVTQGMSVEKAITLIRGPKGEKVVLSILREDVKNPIDVTIVRDNIVVKSLEWEMKGDIAVLRISQFGTDLVSEFQEAVSQILLQDPRGIIVDVRNDGGGLLDACVRIASEFLDQKVIVRTKGRQFGDSGDIMSGRDGAFAEISLVVLVNEGSASASEIFAGAVQDNARGLVIGQKTFGKGSVQNVIPLSDGSSLKVTIAEWLTPGGRSISEKGIDPDIAIEMDMDDIEAGNDPIMDKAMEIIGTDSMKSLLMEKGNKSTEEKTE